MTYKEYKVALRNIDSKYTKERERLLALIYKIEEKKQKGFVLTEIEKIELDRLYKILEYVKNRGHRSVERLKFNFATQDTTAKVGDIIWAGQRVLKVTEISLASFEYPMLKYFGKQLTMKGLPCKNQKEYPQGGIYQKDITSINGDPYIYNVRE